MVSLGKQSMGVAKSDGNWEAYTAEIHGSFTGPASLFLVSVWAGACRSYSKVRVLVPTSPLHQGEADWWANPPNLTVSSSEMLALNKKMCIYSLRQLRAFVESTGGQLKLSHRHMASSQTRDRTCIPGMPGVLLIPRNPQEALNKTTLTGLQNLELCCELLREKYKLAVFLCFDSPTILWWYEGIANQFLNIWIFTWPWLIWIEWKELQLIYKRYVVSYFLLHFFFHYFYEIVSIFLIEKKDLSWIMISISSFIV